MKEEVQMNEDNELGVIQKQLAHDMNIEFIDTRVGWIEYLVASGKSLEYFYRDVVHGNDPGKQIVDKIIVDHFNIHPVGTYPG